MSLATRLALLVFAVFLLVLGGQGMLAWRFARGELETSFDSALQANAEALASLVEVEEEGELELEFADEVMTRFSRAEAPDVFAVYQLDGDDAGALLERSRDLAIVPAWAAPGNTVGARDFLHNGRAYRGVALDAVADSQEEEHAVGERADGHEGGGREERILQTVPFRVFFATSRASLDVALEELSETLTWVSLIAIAIAALGAFVVSRQGLRPLRRFADKLAAVTPERIDADLNPADFPLELREPARSVDALLARLRAAFERERRFSADAAHELRTPVATLKTTVQAARRAPRDAAEDAETLADLEGSIERLATLCEQLLQLARADSAQVGKATTGTTLDASKLHACLGDEIAALRPLAEARGATLRFESPPPAPPGPRLAVDASAVERIVGNLVRNALDHGGPGVAIRVALAFDAGGGGAIEVADNGVGIPPEARERLFERFFRVDPSRSRHLGGAGLGLALCRELARRRGGDADFRPT